MESLGPILFDLFIILASAKLAAEVFSRLRQPAVIGEILVGVLIGPFALGWIGLPDTSLLEAFHGEATASEALGMVYRVLAEIGIIILLFQVGLETRASELFQVGRRALVVATLGVAVPFILGYGYFL